MNPRQQFDVNILAADHYVSMYTDLRRLKGLGTRGQLDSDNRHLLWLPRGAVVAALSSLDAYIHQILYARLPALLNDPSTAVSDSLADLVVQVAPIKKPDSARDALQFVRAANGAALLADRIKAKILQYASYQAPEKLILAYSYLGISNPFESVAAAWPGPNTTAQQLKDRLVSYVKRRHQIAHEGDLDTNNQPRSITPDISRKCVDFVKGLVARLDAM